MPTIKDVAAEAGVTSTTVSRVLNNRGYISEETREKVYSAMEKLNYMPNEMARNLSRQKSDYIGVILPSVEHPYFSKVLHWLEHYVTKHNYKIMVCISENSREKELQYIDLLYSHRVLGIVVCSHIGETMEHLVSGYYSRMENVTEWQNFYNDDENSFTYVSMTGLIPTTRAT